MVCREWISPGKYINPLCGNILFPATGNPSCPICIVPRKLSGPTGCFGCPIDEQFPAVWHFNRGLRFDLPGITTVTSSDSTAYPLLNNVAPGRTPPATITTVIDMPGAVESHPLMVQVQMLLPSGASQYDCVWGWGRWRFPMYFFRKTFGSPSPPPGSCSLTAGRFENIGQHAGEGPWYYPSGASSVGNPDFGNYVPPGSFDYSPIPECPFPVSLATLTNACLPYNPGCFPSSVLQARSFQISAYNWYLYSPIHFPGRMSLYLTISGHKYSVLSEPCYASGPFGGPGYITAGPELTPQWIDPVLPFPTQGAARWDVEYPCGTPSTVTLSLAQTSGILASPFSSMPATITLRRG